MTIALFFLWAGFCGAETGGRARLVAAALDLNQAVRASTSDLSVTLRTETFVNALDAYIKSDLQSSAAVEVVADAVELVVKDLSQPALARTMILKHVRQVTTNFMQTRAAEAATKQERATTEVVQSGVQGVTVGAFVALISIGITSVVTPLPPSEFIPGGITLGLLASALMFYLNRLETRGVKARSMEVVRANDQTQKLGREILANCDQFLGRGSVVDVGSGVAETAL